MRTNFPSPTYLRSQQPSLGYILFIWRHSYEVFMQKGIIQAHFFTPKSWKDLIQTSVFTRTPNGPAKLNKRQVIALFRWNVKVHAGSQMVKRREKARKIKYAREETGKEHARSKYKLFQVSQRNNIQFMSNFR